LATEKWRTTPNQTQRISDLGILGTTTSQWWPDVGAPKDNSVDKNMFGGTAVFKKLFPGCHLLLS